MEPGTLLHEAAERGQAGARADHDDWHIQLAGEAECGTPHEAGQPVPRLLAGKPAGANALVDAAGGHSVVDNSAGHVQALGVHPRPRGQGVKARLEPRRNAPKEHTCMCGHTWGGDSPAMVTQKPLGLINFLCTLGVLLGTTAAE